MLSSLYISNYALINTLRVDFRANLNTVTGETGAGKSIILGALGLILGNRADLSVLKEKEKKCVVEGTFSIKDYQLERFFEAEDLDYDSTTVLRREITPSGKTRAFINDTPVNLKTLRELGLKLIDIHSQHQNLELGNQKFQLNLVDAVAGASQILSAYKTLFCDYKHREKALNELLQKVEKEKADLDYFQFQYSQLEEAGLQENEQAELEQEQERLAHAGEIKNAFSTLANLLDDEHFSVIRNVKDSEKALEKINRFMPEVAELQQRLDSAMYELRDIVDEAERLSEGVDFNPARIEEVSERLNLIYALQQKHRVPDVQQLIELRDELETKIGTVIGYDDEITEMKTGLDGLEKQLEQKADELSKLRIKAFSKIEKSVVKDLTQLGMPKARFKVEHHRTPGFQEAGNDAVTFLFSANSDARTADISKIASGGEMSRLMLAIKNLLRHSKALPTIIFDEIDAGISGEIALKMGTLIQSFSESTQIINITHLPQIAARGNAHFYVFKYEEKGKTYTSIKALGDEERVEELAKMVGGEKLTETTLSAARQLLNK